MGRVCRTWFACKLGAIVSDMRRHAQQVTVTEKHEVIVRLPSDFPPGEAEVVVLSKVKEPLRGTDLAKWLDEWIASFPKLPRIRLDEIDRDDIYR